MIPLVVAASLYLWTAWNYVLSGRHAMALAFVAYAIANLAFALDMKAVK